MFDTRAGTAPGLHYVVPMSFLLGRMVRNVVRRVARDPKTSDVATKAGRDVADEVKSIAQDKDPARAAGRSFKRALGKLQGEGIPTEHEPSHSECEGAQGRNKNSRGKRR